MDEVSYNRLMAHVSSVAKETASFFSGSLSVNSPEYSSSGSSEKSPEYYLKNIFGYKEFRPLQKEIIQNVIQGRDTLAVLPTGGGKSLCYQIPSLMMKGLTLVVSPLIALMQDQVSQLEQFGINALYLNSSLEYEEYVNCCRKIREGNVKLLYVSPEGLNTGRMRELLHSENVELSCITIDEAHCISSWGHDFRPDYLEISSLREEFPRTVCLALTATATARVREDIVKSLNMENPAVLVASFNRPNLFLEVKRKDNPALQIAAFLSEHKGESGIVYCFSRRQTDSLCAKLQSLGFKALNYHAGLSDEERRKNQNLFIKDKADVMVATLAFGMGINKPDVRFVIHCDMPKSIEQYYQEIGRAGRDGLPAQALLLYSSNDIKKIRFFFEESADPEQAEKLLQGMISFSESRECRRKTLLSYFGENYEKADDREAKDCCCDICRYGPVNEEDVTIPAQKYMSCILRTKERFGSSYIIDVLMGSRSKRILENHHEALSTWGIGKELSKSHWKELGECLLSAGYVEASEEHNVLCVTDTGYRALKNRSEIHLPVNFSKQSRFDTSLAKTSREKTSLAKTNLLTDEESERIATELRAWRRKVSDEENVPPYVIFGDKTLFDIARKKPSSRSELLDCYGIGEAKAEHFGSAILRIVEGS